MTFVKKVKLETAQGVIAIKEKAYHSSRAEMRDNEKCAVKTVQIGKVRIKYEHRGPDCMWGRFGGGWDWKLGFQYSSGMLDRQSLNIQHPDKNQRVGNYISKSIHCFF